MRHLLRPLCIWLLLLLAQQGAVVHELSHASGVSGAEIKLAGGSVDTTCALCPAFAQVVAPAFSHPFVLPLLLRAAVERTSTPPIEAFNASIPTPRSRGPPSLS
jgi:hypothetical protein